MSDNGIASYVAQKERVKRHLRTNRSCAYEDFEPRINKLSGVIVELRKQGWDIEIRYLGGGVRRYVLVAELQPELIPPKGVFPGEPPPVIEPQETLFDD